MSFAEGLARGLAPGFAAVTSIVADAKKEELKAERELAKERLLEAKKQQEIISNSQRIASMHPEFDNPEGVQAIANMYASDMTTAQINAALPKLRRKPTDTPNVDARTIAPPATTQTIDEQTSEALSPSVTGVTPPATGVTNNPSTPATTPTATTSTADRTNATQGSQTAVQPVVPADVATPTQTTSKPSKATTEAATAPTGDGWVNPHRSAFQFLAPKQAWEDRNNWNEKDARGLAAAAEEAGRSDVANQIRDMFKTTDDVLDRAQRNIIEGKATQQDREIVDRYNALTNQKPISGETEQIGADGNLVNVRREVRDGREVFINTDNNEPVIARKINLVDEEVRSRANKILTESTQEMAKLRDRQDSYIGSVLLFQEIDEILTSSPEAARSVVNIAASLQSGLGNIDTAVGMLAEHFKSAPDQTLTIDQVQSMIGFNLTDAVGPETKDLIAKKRELEARLVLLAFGMAGAEGQTGQALSNADFDRFKSAITGGDAPTIISKIKGLLHIQRSRIDNRTSQVLGPFSAQIREFESQFHYSPVDLRMPLIQGRIDQHPEGPDRDRLQEGNNKITRYVVPRPVPRQNQSAPGVTDQGAAITDRPTGGRRFVIDEKNLTMFDSIPSLKGRLRVGQTLVQDGQSFRIEEDNQ